MPVKRFFWSSAVYFFFHPVRIFQFTSLLFSDPSLRYNETCTYQRTAMMQAIISCFFLHNE